MRRLRRELVAVSVLLAEIGLLFLGGCRNPGQSTLPPSAVSSDPHVLPPLPKGDVYADETVPTSETPIEVGDTLEVVIRRGAGEEKFSSWYARTDPFPSDSWRLTLEGAPWLKRNGVCRRRRSLL